MLISVHLPKTAGTSFIRSLQSHFGASLLRDYDDLPLNTPQYERNKAALLSGAHIIESGDFSNIDCIHGHFLPLKYLLLGIKKDLKFITWLRDPVERVLSHYYFWKNNCAPAPTHRLHQKMVDEDWSVEKFCLSPETQNIYGLFLWGFPIEYFDFIGITENYSEDLSWFSKNYLNTCLETHVENVGNKEGDKYSIDESFRIKLEQFHAKDIELYKKALEMRQKRQITST